MMKNGWVILAAAGVVFAGAWTVGGASEKVDARGEFARGEEAYAKGEFAEAAEAFWAASEGAAAEGLDADAARFNALVAAENAGEGGREVGERVLGASETTADVGLQAQLHFNRGNAWMRRAEEAEQAGAIAGNGDVAPPGGGMSGAAGAMELVGRAVEEYREAVLRDGGNLAYKQNYELGVAKLEELKQAVAQQQQQQQGEGEDQEQEQQEQEQQQEGENDDSQQEEQEGAQQQQESAQSDDSQSEGREGEEQEGEEGQAQPQPRGEEMTEEEAERLMDAMKEREEGQRDGLRVILGRPVPVEKDW